MEKIKPRIRGGICLTLNPDGLERALNEQIERAQRLPPLAQAPKSVLVLGCSGGYGLSARVVAAHTGGADTFGVSFERAPDEKSPGSPGWHNNRVFDLAPRPGAARAVTLMADAFLPETKQAVADQAKEAGFAPFDLVIYSLAAPLRKDPNSEIVYRSAIKPIGTEVFRGQSINIVTGQLVEVTVEPATEEEIEATVKVMGGEDWVDWIESLRAASMLAPGAVTVAFSYIGPAETQDIYRSGTLGRAKAHLEKSAFEISSTLEELGGAAYVSVNKALVTRASSVIPAMPPYICALYREMKARGLHEGCFEQAARLFAERLYSGAPVPVDEEGRIRIDDWEMRPEVQQAVAKRLEGLSDGNLAERVDFAGYQAEFLELYGFTPDDLS